MTEEPTISELKQQLDKIQQEQLESDKCAQRNIQNLQQQISECIKQTHTLKYELQNLQEQLRKSRI